MIMNLLSKCKGLSLFILTFSSLCFADLTVQDRDGHEVKLVIASTDALLEKDREVFVSAFSNNYQDVPIQNLNPEFKTQGDVDKWLNDYFDEEEKLLRAEQIFYVRAYQDGKLIGWASFEKGKAKDSAAYVRHMAISPDYQRKGIGKQLLFSIKNDNDLLPNTQRIYLITRRLNTRAISFYEKHGFRESHYMRVGLDSSRYVGFEWKIQ